MSPRIKRIVMTFVGTFVATAVASITSSQLDLSTVSNVAADKALVASAAFAGIMAGLEAAAQYAFSNVDAVPTEPGRGTEAA